jgi:hypothetical protein
MLILPHGVRLTKKTLFVTGVFSRSMTAFAGTRTPFGTFAKLFVELGRANPKSFVPYECMKPENCKLGSLPLSSVWLLKGTIASLAWLKTLNQPVGVKFSARGSRKAPQIRWIAIGVRFVRLPERLLKFDGLVTALIMAVGIG